MDLPIIGLPNRRQLTSIESPWLHGQKLLAEERRRMMRRGAPRAIGDETTA
jgi:hypothetical protein